MREESEKERANRELSLSVVELCARSAVCGAPRLVHVLGDCYTVKRPVGRDVLDLSLICRLTIGLHSC